MSVNCGASGPMGEMAAAYQMGYPMSLCWPKVAIISAISATASGEARRKASQSRRTSASGLLSSVGGYIDAYRPRDHRRAAGTARAQEVSMPASLASLRSCHESVEASRSEAKAR